MSGISLNTFDVKSILYEYKENSIKESKINDEIKNVKKENKTETKKEEDKKIQNDFLTNNKFENKSKVKNSDYITKEDINKLSKKLEETFFYTKDASKAVAEMILGKKIEFLI